MTLPAPAERSVIGSMLSRPKVIPDVIATHLQAEHFPTHVLSQTFDAIVDGYFADTGTDPISIAERLKAKLGDVTDSLRTLALDAQPHEAVGHARIVKRDYDRRVLVELGTEVARRATVETPEELAAEISQRAMEVATSRMHSSHILSYGDLGRRFVQRQRELKAAREAGIEIGVRFGMRFMDDRLHGLKPTEMWILAGEPGVGKSAVAFCAATAYAARQFKNPEDERMATLVLSLEMGEEPSADRLAQSEGGVDSAKLRDGTLTDDELARIVRNWGGRRELPLYFNFTSLLRASQARALIAEAIRRYNVGLVVVDHMRYFDSDERYDNAADEDEAKARFLKERIAKELNVVVMLLAHTTKSIEHRDGRRPTLSDLRGGGMVAAHADVVSFVYSQYRNADEESIEEDRVARTDMEMLWEKNRQGLSDPTDFTLDPSRMILRDRI
jgi:replicative DNA helicase